jgi:signal recognition particle subunit SEC65
VWWALNKAINFAPSAPDALIARRLFWREPLLEMSMQYSTYINGRVVPQQKIDAWEQKRILAVAKKLGATLDTRISDLDLQSRQLASHKQALGYEEIIRRLGPGLQAASMSAMLMNALSVGRRRVSSTEMVVEGISAGEIARGIESLMLEPSTEHETANLGACPDHYALRQLGNGHLEVIETTGGSPFPIQFFIEFGSEAGLTVPKDVTYPYQSAGIAHLRNGSVIGGVRHQFRDEGAGFRVKLAVEFPLITPGYFIHQHQLHLACEFGRWFRWLYAHKKNNISA